MYESLLQLTDASDFTQKVLACGHVNLVNPTQCEFQILICIVPYVVKF